MIMLHYFHVIETRGPDNCSDTNMALNKQYRMQWRLYLEPTPQQNPQSQYARDFGTGHVPMRQIIGRLIATFKEAGIVGSNNKGNSGRPLPPRTPNRIETLRDRLQESPRMSTRLLQQEEGIQKLSVTQILQQDLKLFPYKIKILQHQTERNKEKRFTFCQNISQRTEDNLGMLYCIFFSDKAHCYLIGHSINQNIIPD